MTATAQELLDHFAEIGASVCAVGEDRLVVRAGGQAIPAAWVRQLREEKAHVLAALASGLETQAGDAADPQPTSGQQRFNRTIHWGPSGSKNVNSLSAVDALRVARIGGNNLRIVGDDLVLEACSPPPTVVLDLLSRHKADVIRLLLPGRDGWSAQDWQVFFDERVEICKLDGLVPREQAEDRAVDWCVTEWLNRNPMCSPADSCFGCGGKEEPLDPLLPFGIGTDGSRVWLHSRCQPAWYAGRKTEAIAALAPMGIVPPADYPKNLGKNDADACDERAAIIELGAGVPRDWAEGYAALCIMPPPPGFTAARWQQITDAAGVFLDRWAAKAATCGWSVLDVFGCDPTRPDVRLDCMGIVLLLGGGEVVGVDEHGADLMTKDGARTRFYRHSALPPRTVSLWQLQRMMRLHLGGGQPPVIDDDNWEIAT